MSLSHYSSPIRTAAAAARGARVTPSTAIAPNKYIGGAIDSPVMARCVASAPNTRIGTASGNVSNDSSTPPRRAPSVRPALIAPTRLSAKPPSANEATTLHIAPAGTPRPAAATGADNASGRPVISQCVQVLANNIQVSD